MENEFELKADLHTDTKFDMAFMKYHQINPHVFETFCYYARQLIVTNCRKTSGWLIVNRMRWESLINGVQADDYKFPNDYIGVYTRAFSIMFPHHRNLFAYKSTKRDLDKLAEWLVKDMIRRDGK